MKNHKATKPVGPSLACQRNAISMAFRCRAYDGSLIVAFESSLPSSTKKKRCHSETPSDKIFWIRTCVHNGHDSPHAWPQMDSKFVRLYLIHYTVMGPHILDPCLSTAFELV